MTLTEISKWFQRALLQSFEKRTFFLGFCTLFVSCILILFFHRIAFHSGFWVRFGLQLFPLFLAGALLFSSGVLLLRISGKPLEWRRLLPEAFYPMMIAFYLGMLFLLAFLILWIILGISILLREIPLLGTFFGVIFSFVPFALFFATILLLVFLALFLFFGTPILAFRDHSQGKELLRFLIPHLRENIFLNLLCFLMALIPFAILFPMLWFSFYLTELAYFQSPGEIEWVLQRFFMLIPFVAFLTPAVNFFFNFSKEIYLWKLSRADAQAEGLAEDRL